MNRIRLCNLIILVSITVMPACSGPQGAGADTVFVNGAVYTVDESRSWAEAVAITAGEIVFNAGRDIRRTTGIFQ